MIKLELTLTPEQLSYLQAALDKAMDNEGDAEYYAAYSELSDVVAQAMETA